MASDGLTRAGQGATLSLVQTLLCPVQVGRQAETAMLADAVAAVRSARTGRAVVLAGEAGVGKSRLAAEVQRLAGERGLVRLVGECTLDASIPYAPFVTALRRHTRRLDNDALARLFDGPALLAAALLPEAARVVALPEALRPAPEDLFAATWQLLARLCGDGAGLLLVEDTHWADQDTLRLLGYLVRELDDLPLLVVSTHRPDEMHRRHPLQALLTELARERRIEEVRLHPLDREQVRELLSFLFDGTEVSDEFLDALHSRAAGNPFFVEELAKGLVERGDIYHDGTDWARRSLGEINIPETVRETVLARCRDLSDDALRVLQLAAVAGDLLDPAVLTRAAAMTQKDVDDVLREALRLQLLVEEADGARASYAFRHALTREVFADELVGPDRRRAHLVVAEALLAEHPDSEDAAAELADHLTRAGEAQRAVPFAIAAARRAADARARDEAVHRYEQALSLMSRNDERHLELLLEAAKATFDPLDRRAAVAFADEALAAAERSGDRVAQARALEIHERDLWHAGDSAAHLEVLRRMLGLVEGLDDWHEAWALRSLSRVLVLNDRPTEAAPLLERGLAVATRAGHHAALSGLHGTRALIVDVDSPEWHEAVTASVEHARRSGDPEALGNILTNSGFMHVWAGGMGQGRTSLEEAKDLYARLKPTDRYSAAGYAWVLALTGDYPRAVEIAVPIADGRDAPARLVALTALVEAAQRTADPDAGALVERLYAHASATGTAQRTVPALAAAARERLRAGSTEEAEPLFELALETTGNNTGKGSHWMFSPDWADALASERDIARLSSWVGRIRSLTNRDPHRHNRAALTLCAAHLADAADDGEQARLLFGQAVDMYDAMPSPARAAEALLGLAGVEWGAGRLDASAAAARRARDVAADIGAHALVARAEAAMDRAAAVPVLATVLFTDIVGSTERAVAAGDTAWRALLERHHTIVRRELARHRGHEIDTAGDGFFASFDTPAPAIRCASAILDALARIGVPVRAGIHTGECQVSDGKLTGLAVHIAARVSAAAGSGELLVSATVRDLVAGSGFAFEDRGRHALKGVPDEWRLFAVLGPAAEPTSTASSGQVSQSLDVHR